VIRPRLGLDCDGVLADFAGWCLGRHNDRHGTTLVHADWTTWWPKDCFGPHAATMNALIEEAIADPEGRCIVDCPPIEGAAACVQELAERFEVHVVTAIPARFLEARIGWLLRHGFPVDAVWADADKCPLIERLRLLAFCDDKATTANQVVERTGARSFLIDTHANRAEPTIRRVRRASLREATDLLLGRRPA
jgi:uncharacterized HAD superfamily protein